MPPAAALLVVTDMQRVFADPASPWYIPRFAALREPILRLTERFGDRIVLTRFLPPSDPPGVWREYYRQWSFAREPAGAALSALAFPWSDMPLPVIDKTTFSGYGSQLRDALHRVSASTLVLCGVSTECCVLATAIAAVDDGVGVRIVGDACASVDDATHVDALHIATTGFAPMITVTTVDEEVVA